ncbi:MAG: beta-ketoacyl synthase chain length factor [Cellvibrio sp.]
MLKLYIDAIGLAAPGMPSWAEARALFSEGAEYQPTPLEKYKPERLPANERRRATDLVRLAFRICEDATAQSPIAPETCTTVFSSSGGDYPIVDQICRTLTETEKLVSPTQFHNSVHNSAAGYWSIAVGSREASTSLSSFDDSFSLGLLEAALLTQETKKPCLFACYDLMPPPPLSSKRLIKFECGIAMILTSQPTANSIAAISLAPCADTQITPCSHHALETLRLDNPAARAFPLLEALTQTAVTQVKLPMNAGSLVIEVAPCV